MINISDFSHAFNSWCTFDYATFSRVMRHTQVAIERNWARKVWTLSDKLIVKWMLCNLKLLPLRIFSILILTSKIRSICNDAKNTKIWWWKVHNLVVCIMYRYICRQIVNIGWFGKKGCYMTEPKLQNRGKSNINESTVQKAGGMNKLWRGDGPWLGRFVSEMPSLT